MGPRTQPLGNPRHVFGWVQELSLRSQAEQGNTPRVGHPSPPHCPGGCAGAAHLAFNCGGSIAGHRTWPRRRAGNARPPVRKWGAPTAKRYGFVPQSQDCSVSLHCRLRMEGVRSSFPRQMSPKPWPRRPEASAALPPVLPDASQPLRLSEAEFS